MVVSSGSNGREQVTVVKRKRMGTEEQLVMEIAARVHETISPLIIH